MGLGYAKANSVAANLDFVKFSSLNRSSLGSRQIRRPSMSKQATNPHRRTFLKTAISAGAAVIAAPNIIPSSALGKDGAVAPSERIVLGGIGIGNRGTYDLG